MGHPGEQSGPVCKITVGRNDLNMKEMGATINARSTVAFVCGYGAARQDIVRRVSELIESLDKGRSGSAGIIPKEHP